MQKPARTPAGPRPPIQVTGILFALVANVLFVYLADQLVRRTGAPPIFASAATLIAPLLAGVATAFYVRGRGGIHALFGGMISIPFLLLLVFNAWQFALFAGAFCALGGALTERILRERAAR